jgi:3-oxoacyl-(acyl-carrier-protein) synthase
MPLSSKDNALDNAAIICGYSVRLPFAANSRELIENLKQGKRVNKSFWFASDREAMKCGFDKNKAVVPLENKESSTLVLLDQLIKDALAQAKLDKRCLAGEKVRVYLTGLGPRVDTKYYRFLYDKNDIEDLKLIKSVKSLHGYHLSQDRLAHDIAHKYCLQYLPPNLNCTSNSSLAAVHMGCQAIAKGAIDLVMVINCSEIKSQDLWFLQNQSMLASDVVQPFGKNSKSVLFAEGFCVMLLESGRHRQARQEKGGVSLRSAYTQISAKRSNDSTYLTRNILKVMQNTMAEAEVTCDNICAIIPHGNGSEISDKAEARALAMLLEKKQVPVLAYKGQIGYTITGSGIVDLIIAHHILQQDELLPSVTNDVIVEEMSQYLLSEQGVVKHHKRHLLKTGVGVDGSIIGVILSNHG